ncbi:hypothetical protein FRC17_001325 [Serendipita sp. 399]|nr:hypothetical protein FRC17_001325 [Serendipita sp. 399]
MSSDPSLLAILFVSTSSKGSHLAFRWPARPKAVPRLARPRPIVRQLDYAWRAAHPSDSVNVEPEDKPFSISTGHQPLRQQTHQTRDGESKPTHQRDRDGKSKEQGVITGIPTSASTSFMESQEVIMQSRDYEWKMQDWSNTPNQYTFSTNSAPGSHTSGPSGQRHGQGSSSKKAHHHHTTFSSSYSSNEHHDRDFDWVLDHQTKHLAEYVFRFDRNLCNQRFELILEELLFLGHPVCIGDDGTWQWEQLYADTSAKSTSKKSMADDDSAADGGGGGGGGGGAAAAATGKPTSRGDNKINNDPKVEASLKSFHFILVLDRPDPAWGGNVNLTRFVDVYYEQLAVKMTAALHFEQSRDNYVERETEMLVDLGETADSYAAFERAALEKSSLARAMRDIFESVQNQRLAHITVGAFELDLQMPWYHSELLRGDFDPEGPGEYSYEDERDERWDEGFGKGWRVKQLYPWNTLLFLEGWEAAAEIEPESSEMLRFREILTPDILFADAATLLDWDLETEVMRMARYMIYLKKAKVSDVVHPKLLNIYVLPTRMETSLAELSTKFQSYFPPTTPALETILAAVSSSPQAFQYFLPSDDHYELYHQILIWLLKNNALIMLHVRFRLVATKEIKEAVYQSSQELKKRASEGDPERGRKRKPSGLGRREEQSQAKPGADGDGGGGVDIEFVPPEGHQPSSPEFTRSSWIDERWTDFDVPHDFEESFIFEPGKATRLEQLWMDEIARQRPDLENRFLRVCEYFDGRTTFDEIQYRSQLKRSQFRQIVSEYDPWVSFVDLVKWGFDVSLASLSPASLRTESKITMGHHAIGGLLV